VWKDSDIHDTGQTGFVKSVLLADLNATESIRLQQIGLGPHRVMGCGLFIPHKGIAAIHQQTDTEH
jgi:hypothetical protein